MLWSIYRYTRWSAIWLGLALLCSISLTFSSGNTYTLLPTTLPPVLYQLSHGVLSLSYLSRAGWSGCPKRGQRTSMSSGRRTASGVNCIAHTLVSVVGGEPEQAPHRRVGCELCLSVCTFVWLAVNPHFWKLKWSEWSATLNSLKSWIYLFNSHNKDGDHSWNFFFNGCSNRRDCIRVSSRVKFLRGSSMLRCAWHSCMLSQNICAPRGHSS